MSTYRAQVVFPYFSQLPEDVITNTLYFTSVGGEPVEDCATVVMPELVQFYNAVYGTGHQMANHCLPNFATVRWYNLADPPPREPLVQPLLVSLTTVASSIPTETACVLSFQGERVSGVPQARRRGRIYLGGLATGWIATGASATFPMMSVAGVNAVATAADNLRTDLAAGTFKWSVWSPTDATFTLVSNGWVDNSPDTQRRRGVGASSRVLWS